jgi:hypothetical protein
MKLDFNAKWLRNAPAELRGIRSSKNGKMGFRRARPSQAETGQDAEMVNEVGEPNGYKGLRAKAF